MGKDTSIASLKEKIDELNQLAWEVRVNDSPKAFQLSEESVKLARSINYTKGLAEALRSLGFAYVRLSKNEEAAPLLMESLSLFQSLNDIRGQAITYEYLGIIERNWGNLGRSLELLLKGDVLIRQIGSAEIEVTSNYQIGVTYKHLGNHENALDYLYKSLSIAKNSGNILMEAYATNIIGSIYFDNGDYNHALDCYQSGLIIRRESHDKWGEAGSLDNIGFTYLKLKDLDKAIDYCKQSLAISQSTGDKKGEANALLHLAEIYEQAGDIKQASKFSNESLQIRKARGDRRGETEGLLFLADLHKGSGDAVDNQILEWLSGALKIAEEIKAQDLLSKAYYNLHEYYTQRGNFKESLIHLEAHLQIEKELHKNIIIQKVSNLEISHKAETISQRNKELTELNEKIEKANAELKIETSLERVRAVAMSMKKPDDLLSICEVLFAELELLGIKELRNAMVNIYNDEKNTFLNYDFSGSLGQSITVFSMIDTHPVPDYITKQIRQAKNPFAEIALTGDQLADWIGFREKNGELPDPKLKNASTLCYYFYSVDTAAIGISTLSSITKQEHEILKRFRNVFDLAYKRYTDIKQAETQAREAQIETGLERVRSKTMAMHKSEEVTGIAVSLNEELLKLGFEGGSTIIIINKETGDTEQWTGFSEDKSIKSCYVPYFKHPYHDAMFNAWENENFLVYTLAGDEKRSIDEHYFSTGYKIFPESDKKWMQEMRSVTFSHAFMKYGAIHWGPDHLTEEQLRILQRFAKVFEQSYTRFLDLQKAEAQAREAQIEAAVEKVRSRSLAMHKSDELQEVVHTVFERLKELNVDFYTAIIVLFTENSKDLVWWLESKANQQYSRMSVPFTPIKFFNDLFEIKEKGADLLSKCYSFDEKNELFNHLFGNTGFKYVPENQKQFLLGAEFATISVALARNTGIHISNYSKRSFSDQDNQIIKRFANVFDQAYTRFLDLQKAEAQAREAQIEAALERVRSRTMGMHKSDELLEVVAVVFQQMQLLGFNINLCNIVLFNPTTLEADYWVSTNEQEILPESYHIPYFDHPFYQFQLNAWKKTEALTVFNLEGETKKSWDEILFTQTDLKRFPASLKEMMKELEKIIISSVATKHGLLQVIGLEPLSNEYAVLVSRFAKVFEQTYTRFLDLQKAEAQAREAQIEAALERVRSRSMAMHKSDELREVVAVLFAQLQHIGFDIKFCTLALIDKVNSTVEFWLSGFSQEILPESYHVPNLDHPFYQNFQKAFRQGSPYKVFELAGEEKSSYDKLWFSLTDFKNLPEPVKKPMMEMERVVLSCAFTKNGMIQIGGFEPLSDTDASVVQRFAKVFEQTHTRFLDLQKAEAQSREAQIELGLERVRARAMAMQKSDELKELIATVSTELSKLDIILDRCFIMIYDIKTLGVTWWMANPETSADPIGLYVKYHEQVPYLAFLKAWHDRVVKWQFILEGSVKKTWDEFLFVETELSKLPNSVIDNMRANDKVYLSASFNNFGCLTLATLEPLSDEQFDIMLRFAKVFDLTYTRFNDLKQAEAQAREARIETALERVRARALAMQEPEELKDVAQVLRTEMGLLGVEELETCSIYINDENAEKAECWYALKDISSAEKKLVNDHFALNLNDTWVGREMLRFYRSSDKQISIVMQGENRKEWIHYCEERSVPFRGYYGKVIPDRTYHLYKFSHGAIGAAAAGDISEESWRMLNRAASVFSLAYSRFKDLTQARNDLLKLKEEKKRAEEALTELQATQKQLIQSEKMASLGELTAGIAHEIQNPLNFVNNFSDVSNELLEEMKTELEKGNAAEAKAIAGNVKENLEKILHHGKRADAIVKGMLQHSRSSSGQKELTDINTLAEEYLRLSYHGLRAKDKFFNAKFETDLDPTLNKINIVPQEIGRVILNLINNSFYAVNEKKKNTGNVRPGDAVGRGYDPIITVSTKKVNDKVEIRVKDNGNGIPQKTLDKIFQPFFTTKPTGQGTGLGLSLSYDIITKGHGGEIKVETKEGEGSEFTITLPMN